MMDDYVPFPVDTLPASVARFVRETSAAMNCDAAFVALPALCTMAGAIGTAREIVLLDSWREPAIVWGTMIARSGTVKSPAAEAAIKPLSDAEHLAQLANQEAQAEYEDRKLQYEKELAAWKRPSAGGDPPEKPDPPSRRRFIVADVTLEGLAPILQENPRGVFVWRDELAAWVRSHNQYKKNGGDSAAWLELHRAGRLSVDRKTDRATIYLSRTAVSLYGTIQPSIFANVMRGEHFESGLAARLLVVHPPAKLKQFTRRAPSEQTRRAYADLIVALTQLEQAIGEHGPLPVALGLDGDALTVWTAWYDAHAVKQHEAPDDATAAALAKIEAYAARFALIFQLADDPASRLVCGDAMRRACALADWFANEAERVYCRLADDPETAELRQLVSWIERKGGRVTARDLTRGPRVYRDDPSKAEQDLNQLVEGGIGEWRDSPQQPEGGRPALRTFVLRRGDNALGDKTPDGEPESGVLSPSPVSPVCEWGEV